MRSSIAGQHTSSLTVITNSEVNSIYLFIYYTQCTLDSRGERGVERGEEEKRERSRRKERGEEEERERDREKVEGGERGGGAERECGRGESKSF